MGIRDKLIKRLTRTTYDNSGSMVAGFNRAGLTNPYTNETTWLQLYKQEPFIRGAIDSIVVAVVGEWGIESVDPRPTKTDDILRFEITNDFTNPKMKTRTKLATMVYKLIIDSLFHLETNAKDVRFYVLNKEDCTVIWNDDNKDIIEIGWKEISSGNYKEILKLGEFVIASLFDPDTNLWQASAMEALIDIGNLLYHARKYNLDIFRQGGVPSTLYTLPIETTKEQKAEFTRLVKNVKSGKNLIALGDVKAIQIAGFTKDMEYNVLVDHAIQSIMTLLGVSPLMMNLAVKEGSGGGGEGTRQEMNAFASRIHNLQRIINDAMTEVIHNIYGDHDEEPEGSNVTVGRPKKDRIALLRFKLRKWVDTRQQAAMHKIYLDTGVINPNEARLDIGKEPRVGGDKYTSVNDRQASGNTGGENPSGQNRDDNQEDDSNEGENQNDGNRVEDK